MNHSDLTTPCQICRHVCLEDSLPGDRRSHGHLKGLSHDGGCCSLSIQRCSDRLHLVILGCFDRFLCGCRCQTLRSVGDFLGLLCRIFSKPILELEEVSVVLAVVLRKNRLHTSSAILRTFWLAIFVQSPSFFDLSVTPHLS